MSIAIRKCLKINKSNQHWESLLPYNLEELQLHLQGSIGLTTKRVLNSFWVYFYGEYYHIDHVRPVSSFDKDQLQNYNSIDFQECWSLSNLWLLSPIENLKKGAKYGNLRCNS